MRAMKKTPYLLAITSSLFVSTAALSLDPAQKTALKADSDKTSAAAAAAAIDPKAAISAASRFADDTMSKAMEDELLRSITELKITGRPSPYFVSYLATDSEAFSVYGSFGALDQVSDSRYRRVSADVRVGDYKLDSSGKRFFEFGGRRGGSCSLDDNYDAIRHELWLDSDYAYKRAIESLDNKKAILQQKKVESLPDSMSRTKPEVSMQNPKKLAVNKDDWKERVRTISGVFRDYPAVIDSTVALLSRSKTRWFANSEGSINRESNQEFLFGISANGQSPDGMRVSDFEVFAGRDENAIPTKDELEEKARELAKRVKALTEAKPIDDYRGPILFEKQAAAELFAQALAPRLTNKTDSIAAFNSRFEPANDKIGRRILPQFISVIDDPTVTEFNGQQLKGGYLVDDEGVRAQKVTLVENGYLKTFCSGRTPSREVKESNGHWLNGSATTTQMFIDSSRQEPLSKLKERLIELGKEEALEYVLVVRHITSGVLGSITPGRSSFYLGEGNQIHLTQPTLLYKVYVKDGREELVRGANFTRLSHRLFRDIQSTGDDATVYPVRYPNHYGTTGSTIVTPSILISEVDIERESHQTDMPMLLKNSYFGDKDQPKASN